VSQLKKGVALSYVLIFLTNAIGLVLTPFIIRSLGKSEYGLYTMIGALVGYMTVLDFGLNTTIVRFVAKYRAEKNKKGEENFLAHSFIVYGAISLVIIILGVVVYVNLENLYGDTLTLSQLKQAKVMFLVLIFNLSISLPGGAFVGICSGYEEFVLPRVANIIRYVFRSILIVALLILGGNAVGIVIVDTSMNLIIIAVNMLVVFKKLNVRIKLHHFERSLLKLITGFSIWIFVFAIVHQLRWQIGQMVLGLTFSTSVVAVYAVGVTLGNYYGAFSSAISSVFLPRATQMVTINASSKELTDMFIKVSRLILIVLLYIFGGFIIIGQDFIYFWVGSGFEDVYLYVVLIMLGLTLILSQGFGNNILEAKYKLKFRGILMLTLTVLGLASGVLFSQRYQGLGMIIGTVIFMLIERAIMTWYYQKRIHLQMLRYYKEILPLFLLSFLVVLSIYYFGRFSPIHSIKYFFAKTLVFSVFYFASLLFVLTGYEKTLFTRMIVKVINKFHYAKP
jgi:O-antigen/teichoic acid export membrane protein